MCNPDGTSRVGRPIPKYQDGYSPCPEPPRRDAPPDAGDVHGPRAPGDRESCVGYWPSRGSRSGAELGPQTLKRNRPPDLQCLRWVRRGGRARHEGSTRRIWQTELLSRIRSTADGRRDGPALSLRSVAHLSVLGHQRGHQHGPRHDVLSGPSGPVLLQCVSQHRSRPRTEHHPSQPPHASTPDRQALPERPGGVRQLRRGPRAGRRWRRACAATGRSPWMTPCATRRRSPTRWRRHTSRASFTAT